MTSSVCWVGSLMLVTYPAGAFDKPVSGPRLPWPAAASICCTGATTASGSAPDLDGATGRDGRLPHRRGLRYVTDGGLETDLIPHHGIDLPDFAAFPLVHTPEGRRRRRRAGLGHPRGGAPSRGVPHGRDRRTAPRRHPAGRRGPGRRRRGRTGVLRGHLRQPGPRGAGLGDPAPWHDRLVVLRPHASALSHAELDERETLDEGEPQALAADVARILDRIPGWPCWGAAAGATAATSLPSGGTPSLPPPEAGRPPHGATGSRGPGKVVTGRTIRARMSVIVTTPRSTSSSRTTTRWVLVARIRARTA